MCVSLDKSGNAICNLSSRDAAAILALNNIHAKETSLLDDGSLTELLGLACYARGIDRGATALLIALDDHAAYVNPNFRWFKESGDAFVYVERIIVSPAGRGQGIARALYQDLFVAAKRAGHNRVGCEVNIDPPNPVSEAFHRAMGFEEIGQATIHNGTKTVRYFEKLLG